MLTCRDVTELVTDYAEGRLGLVQGIRFRMHIGMCPRCRLYLRQVRAVVAAAPAAPVPEAPPDVVDELSRRFAARPPAKTRFTVRALDLLGGAGGLAIAIAIVVAFAGHAIVFGAGGSSVGPWAECLAAQLLAGALTLGAGAWLLRGRAAPGGWALSAAVGASAASAALGLTCPAPPTVAHLLVVHAGGVALAVALAGTSRALLPRMGRVRDR